MSTLDPLSPPASAAPSPAEAASGTPTQPVVATGETATVYRLVYNDPEDPALGYGLGWTLVGQPTGGWRWSLALAARGAGVHAGPRVAKAVAVRVLAQRGVTVEAWADDHHDPTHDAGPASQSAMFRALLRPAGGSMTEPGLAETPSRARLRIRRLRGH